MCRVWFGVSLLHTVYVDKPLAGIQYSQSETGFLWRIDPPVLPKSSDFGRWRLLKCSNDTVAR